MRKALWTLAALLVWSLALWRGIGVFGPGTDLNDVSYNSDSAIPVLMANDQGPITIFNFYYYGADRWGGWPFVVCQGINRFSGYYWTPERLTAFQTVWVFVGALAFASLDRDARLLSGLVYLAVLCLYRGHRFLLFEMSQVYGWQITGMLLGWASMRQVFNGFLDPARSHRWWRHAGWTLVTLGATWLAVWSSVASAVCLLVVLGMEVLRAGLRMPAPRRALVPGTLGFLAIAGATLLERAQKVRYNHYSLEHYGDPFRTTFAIDWGYLGVNLSMQWQHLTKLSWWPLYVVATLAVAGLAGAYAYTVIARREAGRARLAAWLAEDTAWLVIAGYGIALVHVALAVLVSHVRLNDYDDRYLTIPHVFVPVSGVLTIYLILRHTLRGPRARTLLRPACLATGVVLLVAAYPHARETPEYRMLRRTAEALASKAPRAVLMGTYWDTYVFTSLQPRDPMIAVPFEGHHFRTPWAPAAIPRATQIVVATPHLPSQPPPNPSATLRQYGNSLKLADPLWYADQAYAFALYVHDKPSN